MAYPRFFAFFPVFFFLVLYPNGQLSAQSPLDNDSILRLLDAQELKWEGEPGSWMVYYEERILVLLTDEANNRMRIFTPIASEEDMTAKEMRQMLEANFHSALDAKYALYEGFVVSVFTHPLRELSKVQFLESLRQVSNLARTYGTTFSSSELHFGKPEAPAEPPVDTSPLLEKRS